ncbi:AfsR/SARP family transcriptional regulator [Micromonospora viridifaciens]|uniref:AfsR/SARP family transcriptional regulator n=1 Tax=Micromonospora viridifaciens TaxID=1881 RepID=UPI0018D4E138|nr:BTAD domain-containing putative transcriptional regulator [Micromonospora viridifaciens]
MLSLLAAEANQPVSVDTLVEELWDGRPPKSAIANIRTYVAGLRLALGGKCFTSLRATNSGYILDLPSENSETAIFRELTGRARVARSAEGHAEGLRWSERALSVWRGRPMADVPRGVHLNRHADQLEEEWAAVVEEAAEDQLVLGKYSEAVRPLRQLVSDRPWRERAQARLVLALYGCGDVSGALEAYSRATRHLRVELGVDPGPELVDAHRLVLNREPMPPPPVHERPAIEVRTVPSAATPRELPALPHGLVGRGMEMAALLSAAQMEPSPGRARVLTLCGEAGVGKSALAIEVAHRLAALFPDGQLYLDLRTLDRDGTGAASSQAIARRLLCGLGHTPAQIPRQAGEAEKAFRAAVEDRRVIVVVDNVTNAGQIAPLVPASSTCLLLLSSNAFLPVLGAGRTIRLAPLSDSAAERMLIELVGDRRAEREPRAVERIVHACGHLPLALRVAGFRIACSPQRSLTDFADEFADEGSRLDLLEFGGISVRSSLSIAHRQLRGDQSAVDEAATRMLHSLAWLDTPSLSMDALRAWAGSSRPQDLVDRLAELHLLIPAEADTVRFPTLMRLYCRHLDAALPAGFSRHVYSAALRSRGIPTEVSPSAAKFGKQIRYAERGGIPYVFFPGAEGDEVKDIRSGEQVAAAVGEWPPPRADLKPLVGPAHP